MKPYYSENGITIYHGDCRNVLKAIPDASVDAVISDPPYPEIDRHYGRLSEQEWWDLMMIVCAESRRILKPHGSAMFILQPNSRKVGSMINFIGIEQTKESCAMAQRRISEAARQEVLAFA